MGVTEHPTKIFADQVAVKVTSSILSSFDSVCAVEIHDVARATSCIACALEMRSNNGRERPQALIFQKRHGEFFLIEF